MSEIYILYGQTGEYSDRTDWFVAAYMSKIEAVKHEKLCEAWCHKSGCSYRKNYGSRIERDLLEGKNPYDPGMKVDYTGVQYCILPVPLFERAPEDLESTGA
jgi:hypothetical protein